MSVGTPERFPNATLLPPLIPIPVWRALGLVSVAVALGIVALLLARPTVGLPLFWSVIVPLLPALFFTLPGIWRNICPMATLNQLPRHLGFTRGLTHTPRIREYSYLVGIVLFVALVSSRKWLFDGSGPATAALILFGLTGALVGGIVFKGRSGWCSSICPLLPVQRLYGQTPLRVIENAHCRPCVGCTKNCYDFNPGVAYLADQDDDDRHYVGYRRLFAALLPGFVLAFFTLPEGASIATIYGTFAVSCAISIAAFQVLDVLLKVPNNRLTVLSGATAFALYYWFASAAWLRGMSTLTGVATGSTAVWAIRGVVLLATIGWVVRSFRNENAYRDAQRSAPASAPIRVGAGAVVALQRLTAEYATTPTELVIAPENKRVPAQEGQTLLEVIERCGAHIEAGCRMGVCGADPIAVREGMERLSPIGTDEQNTLERLGHGPNTRMACSARLEGGTVTIAMGPDRAPRRTRRSIMRYDPALRNIVIVGNGVAGVTAADHVRRRHPECAIHLVAEENHPLYNRMGITRLIYGRSAMQGLYLMPDNWYRERDVEVLLNTAARRIDPIARRVELADGEHLPYDRLILATGSSSFVPPLQGFGGPGCFVLRTANDAMGLRAFAHRTHARHGVVAGGGLLGLEAAYALHKLGLRVTVVERSPWLLSRQIDRAGARILQRYLGGLGISVLADAQLSEVAREGDGRQIARLADGNELPADVFLVAAGIAPNVALAREAGLQVNRGVVVDEHMRTSDPNILAAGDVAEREGAVIGLWSVAVEQAEIAACTAVGEARVYTPPVLSTILKVVGADVFSVGRHEAIPGDEVLVEEDPDAHRYRKMIMRDGRLVGAILIGFPELVETVGPAVKAGDTLESLASAGPRRSRALHVMV